ncbi:hypothetical protein FS749_013218, partial [Ceratobasidium sp. UAMH 11750]
MATVYQEARGSPTQDTSDLFGDDDADTNSESDFEEVQVPNGGTAPKPAPEVVDVDDGEDGEEEDDFLPSRVNKYAPVGEGSRPAPTATTGSNPPLKRRRADSDDAP